MYGCICKEEYFPKAKQDRKRRFEGAGWAGKAAEALSHLPHWTAGGPFLSLAPEHGSVPGYGMCLVDVNPGPQWIPPKARTGDVERRCSPIQLDKIRCVRRQQINPSSLEPNRNSRGGRNKREVHQSTHLNQLVQNQQKEKNLRNCQKNKDKNDGKPVKFLSEKMQTRRQ